MSAGSIQSGEQNHVRVDTLSASEWRVCDTRAAANDASSLIGFIDEHDGVFEVMRFADPIEFTFAPSLDVAIAHLTDATCGGGAAGAAVAEAGLRLATVTEIVRAKAAS
jgi:hypothetical protein